MEGPRLLPPRAVADPASPARTIRDLHRARPPPPGGAPGRVHGCGGDRVPAGRHPVGPPLQAVGLGGYNPGTVNEREIQVERAGGEVTLSIDVPAEEIRRKEQDLLAAAQAQLKVPGFRHGKAPQHLVLRHYGEDEFVQDLKDDLVREWVARALRQFDLHPLTTPTVET
ncbi:MAG TPA: trigger factor family protein, partial [Candidatus Acetothermia bacterium]|nr:trigger factor family protein [Candidatus Acetothermia bacterium]